jgi:uncharacterized protein YggE
MNRILLLATALVAVLVPEAFSQAATPLPQISVSGSAEVKVAPDSIHLSLGVETRHETIEEAKQQNDDRVARALAFIKGSGVAQKNVQTDFMSLEPSHDNSHSRIKPIYYTARKSIEVRLDTVQGFEKFVTGLLTNGVTTIQGIDFQTTELRKHRDAARAMAVRAAREKADALASELGVKRGKVYSITANDWSGWGGRSGGYWGGRGGMSYQNAVQAVSGGAEADGGTLSVGQISVTASVTVSFLIE